MDSEPGQVSTAQHAAPSMACSAPSSNSNGETEDPLAVGSRFQSIYDCEQHYRDSCGAEAQALHSQLTRTRAIIEKLHMKLLDALASEFHDPNSTAHIHRELGHLMSLEKTVVERLDEVREKARGSLGRQLSEQSKYFDLAVKGVSNDSQMQLSPSNQQKMRLDCESSSGFQTNHTVNIAPVQVPSFHEQLKEHLKLLVKPLHPPTEFKFDAHDVKIPSPAPSSGPTAPSPPPAAPLKGKKMYHAFLTHNWGDGPTYPTHERVKQICHALKGMGLSLWFDEERMAGGNVIQDMTKGIDHSDVVVVFVTKAYCQKVNKSEYDNCKIEFMYAVNRMCSMMVAVPLDEDMLSTQNWAGPVGAILGSNLYPAKFWDKGEINAQHSAFSVEIKKLYDRIVNLCGDVPAPSVPKAVSAPPSSAVENDTRSDFSIPKKRTHPEFFIAQRMKFCYKVALHACAATIEQHYRLDNAQRLSLSRMRAKFDQLYDRGIRVRDAFSAIIDSHGNCDVEALVEPLDELDTCFVKFVAQLAAPPHGPTKFDDLFRALTKLLGEGKAGRVADLENVLLFHAFLLASPKYVSSDDFLVAYARRVLLEDSLFEMDRRGWVLSEVFLKFWDGHRDIDVLFPSARSDGEQRVVRLFKAGARDFCQRTGLNPDSECSNLSPGDVNPFFDLLVFIKTLGDVTHSQHSHKDLWVEIEKLFDTQPPLRMFKEVVGLVHRQNEWAANIPGPNASDDLKMRYSGRLMQSLKQLTSARADLKACDPAALELWDRATQHAPVSVADLTLQKLNEINFRRQLGGIVKTVLFLACKPPSTKGRAAHSRLVEDVLEVLQVVPITDLSGKNRTMSSFAPIVKHAIRDIIENCTPCVEIAALHCSGDESALFFAKALDDLIWDLNANTELLEELELEFKKFLKPITGITVGRIGVADMMFEVDPVDSHTEQLLSRAAELCFPRYSTTTSGRVCAGGPSKEKEKLIQNWTKVPDVRKVLTALWANPHDFEGAVQGVSHRRTVWFCKRIFSRCQKLAPLETVEYFLDKNKVSMERIANLRDRAYYNIGRHRFCDGGPEMERQRVYDVTFHQLREAGCDVQDAVQALWGGERRRSVLLALCSTELAKDWLQGVLIFVDDLCSDQ